MVAKHWKSSVHSNTVYHITSSLLRRLFGLLFSYIVKERTINTLLLPWKRGTSLRRDNNYSHHNLCVFLYLYKRRIFEECHLKGSSDVTACHISVHFRWAFYALCVALYVKLLISAIIMHSMDYEHSFELNVHKIHVCVDHSKSTAFKLWNWNKSSPMWCKFIFKMVALLELALALRICLYLSVCGAVKTNVRLIKFISSFKSFEKKTLNIRFRQ